MQHPISEIEFSEKQLYYYLGLISTKFASLEYNVLNLLSRLVVDNFVLATTILDKNTLYQNVELIKKINKYQKFEEATVSKLISNISKVRKTRNLFIHGIWSNPEKEGEQVVIQCAEPKILYEEGSYGASWSPKKYYEFRLSDLEKECTTIDTLNKILADLLNKIKNAKLTSGGQ